MSSWLGLSRGYIYIYIFIYLFPYLFNRYRAFRRARNMRWMLYVIRCRFCILGCWCFFGCVLGGLWDNLGYLGACWGPLGTILGGLGGNLGPLWGLELRVWGSITITHTPLKCQNRSRPTPVQRKRLPEKRRCYQALKSHTFRKCKNRSRLTPVQRKRSQDITQVQKD